MTEFDGGSGYNDRNNRPNPPRQYRAEQKDDDNSDSPGANAFTGLVMAGLLGLGGWGLYAAFNPKPQEEKEPPASAALKSAFVATVGDSEYRLDGTFVTEKRKDGTTTLYNFGSNSMLELGGKEAVPFSDLADQTAPKIARLQGCAIAEQAQRAEDTPLKAKVLARKWVMDHCL